MNHYCYYGCLLIAAALMGCGQKTHPSAVTLPASRVIATLYAVHTDTDAVPCYRLPDATSPAVLHLRDHQQVELVSPQGSMVQQGENYWLHVYPRIEPRPACYLNVRHLMPLA
ncbi:hypothetical protein [Thiothrix subterranea]|uniref:Uncharacterized protein n=1 Tax=Thiothrix subterranea TaxID=2735563 RepID=A0AA51R2U4_9GAMM|nr:hypothetical protein [Thiothrix subterranea]MDQ5770045.1 hypothetical protein [Thiothrix subterranea]WML88254.1 hypothetical protein RCG00_07715 [Thiothrix subterranea]